MITLCKPLYGFTKHTNKEGVTIVILCIFQCLIITFELYVNDFKKKKIDND